MNTQCDTERNFWREEMNFLYNVIFIWNVENNFFILVLVIAEENLKVRRLIVMERNFYISFVHFISFGREAKSRVIYTVVVFDNSSAFNGIHLCPIIHHHGMCRHEITHSYNIYMQRIYTTDGAVSLWKWLCRRCWWKDEWMKIDMEKNKDNWVSECEDNVDVDERREGAEAENWSFISVRARSETHRGCIWEWLF